MTCESARSELVECARRGQSDAELEAHLAGCETCRARWDAERNLTAHLRAMRLASVPASIEWSKAVLMREFDTHQSRERKVRWMRGGVWAMSTAAALVFSVMVVRDVRMRPAVASLLSGASGAVRAYPATDYAEENYAPAIEAGEKGFIAVPFATPLAPGEILRIVRTELHPEALASMGVSVEPGWTGALPADLLVGQDGFPRAVRVSTDETDEKGF